MRGAGGVSLRSSQKPITPKPYFPKNILNYVRSHNLAGDEEYEYMNNLLDFDGLIDQKLGEIYSGNTDVGNIRYIRSLDKKSDKKWHYVYYDLDLSWTTFNPSSFYLRQDGGIAAHNLVVDKLLANKKFRERFLKRLSLHIHKTFTPENTTRVFNNIINNIRPEMKRNCQRWPMFGSFKRWEEKCDAFRKKFKTRYKEVLDDLRKELKITTEEDKKYFSDLG